MYSPKEVRAYVHSLLLLSNPISKKCLWINCLINKVCLLTSQSMAHTCWTTFSIMQMLGIKSNLVAIIVTGEYDYMQQHNLNSLFAIEPSMRRMAYQVTCAAHQHSVRSRINYDSCICLPHSFTIYIVHEIIKLLFSSI